MSMGNKETINSFTATRVGEQKTPAPLVSNGRNSSESTTNITTMVVLFAPPMAC